MLNHFSTSNPCPVCGTGTKGCSTDPDTLLYLCRGTESSPEFKFLTYDKNNVFRVFKHESDIKTDKNGKLLNSQWKAKAANRVREQKEKFAQLLSRQVRNAKFTRLVSELNLFSKHQEDLKDRGIFNPQEKGFISLRKYQKVQTDTQGLPGFKNGKYVGTTGMFCPINDVEGNLVGFQIKNDKPEVSVKVVNGVKTKKVSKKYVWTKNEDTTAHLQNGELPLNVAQNGRSVIGFCEGILKSTVASVKHQATFIGASNVGSCPEQIAEIAKFFNLNTITLFPDAGSAVNLSVVSSYKNLAQIAENLGLSFKVANWGQWLSKDQLDIDEIDTLSDVTYHSFEDYIKVTKDNSYYSQLSTGVDQIEGLTVTLIDKLDQNDFKSFDISLSTPQHSSESFLYSGGELPSLDTLNGRTVVFNTTPLEVYNQALSQGYRYILDTSGTGTGKTYTASKINYSEYSDGHYFFCTKSSRNPTVLGIEESFNAFPARHYGYDHHESKANPSGKPQLIATKSKTPDVESNCKWTKLFNLSRNNNMELDLCGKCQFKSKCRKEVGKGYGFKNQIISTMSDDNKKIRANIQSLTPKIIGKDALLVIDEYSQSVNWIIELEVLASVIEKQAYELQNKCLDIFGDFVGNDEDSLFLKIAQKLNKVIHTIKNDKQYKYGMDLKTLRRVFKAELENTEVLEKAIRRFEATLVQENEEYFEAAKTKDKESQAVMAELIRPLWLRDFVEALTDGTFSSVIATNKGITIKKLNTRVLETISHARTVIFQDATGNKYDLAQKLQVDPSEILEIKAEDPDLDNLTVVQLYGLGKLGNSRSKSKVQRIEKLREALDSHYEGNIGFIDFKKYSQGKDLNHFIDGRGSNDYQELEAVCSIGTPIPNLLHVQSDYETLTGKVNGDVKSVEFTEYLNFLIVNEVIQEIGRLRANRRIHEDLDFIWVSDVDSPFLEQIGCHVKRQHVSDYSLECLDSASRKKVILKNVFQEFASQGREIIELTQEEVAKESNIKRTTLSRLAAKYGGWDRFKLMLKYMIEGVDSLPKLNDEELKIAIKASTYLSNILPYTIHTSNTANIDSFLGLFPEKGRNRCMIASWCFTSTQSVSDFINEIVKTLPRNQKVKFLQFLQRGARVDK